MMNGVGGTTLHYWAQSWRLNPWDFRVVSETTRRYGAAPRARGLDGRGLAVRRSTSSSPTTTRSSTRSAYRAKPATSKAASIRAATSSKAPRARALSDAAAARHRVHGPRWPRPRAASAGIRSPGPAADQLAALSEPQRVPVSRLLQPRRLPRRPRRTRRPCRRFRAREATGHLDVVTEAHVTRIDVDAEGRAAGVQYLKDGETYIQPAAVVLLAGYTYENTRLLLLSTSAAYPHGLANNRGQVGQHYFTPQSRRRRARAVPARAQPLVRACRRRASPSTNGPTTTSITRELDFIGGGNLWVYSDQRPIAAASMPTFGRAPRWGSRVEAFVRDERGSLGQLVLAEDDAAVRGQLPRPASDREGPARRSRRAASRPTTRTTRSGSPRSCRTRWSSGSATRARSRRCA